MSQLRFPSMAGLRPPRPTIRDERVALRIAERLVYLVNAGDGYFHWSAETVDDRVTDVWREIMRVGRPATVFARLERQQPPNAPCIYGWEGIDDDCRQAADEIAAEELAAAVKRYDERYGE